MSKKKKGQPIATATSSPSHPAVSPPKPQPAAVRLQPDAPLKPAELPESERPFELIRFDKRVKWTLGVFVGFFVLFVLFKWHFESTSMWNTLLPDGSPETRGLVAGKPRQIRMDDYAVATPSFLSQVNLGLPVENESIGGLKAALVSNPAKHSISIFRPSSWGSLFLDTERGYSFATLQNIFSLLVGSFLLFLVLTRNNYFLSLTGTLTLLLSSGTISWTFIPSAMIGYGSAATVAFLLLLHEKKLPYIALQSFLLIFSVVAFLLILYPPYQVPLVYLFSLLIVGYVLQERKNIFPLPAVGWKLLALAVAMGLSGIVLYSYYLDANETITALTKTVYPGQRIDLGGTGFIANWYSEYYSWSFSDAKFPKSWLNSCEYAHYLTFAPVIIPASAYWFVRNQRINWLLLGGVLFTLLMLVWIEVGLPESIAKASLLSMSPTRRAQIPMGIGSIYLTIIYLSVIQNQVIKVPTWANALAIAAVIAFMIYTAYINVSDADGFLKGYQLVIPVLFFSVMNILLLFTLNIRYRVLLFCGGLLLFLLPNIRLNPLSIGLTPITENALYKAIKPIVDRDPNARWIVNGSQYITYMVTATGAKQLTGVKILPDRKHIFSVLDPEMKRDSAYNRYAHVINQSYINGRDSVILVNQFEDGYVIAMDPCSPRMKQLNVKYQVFDHQPQPVEVRCMKSIATLGSLTIYEANP